MLSERLERRVRSTILAGALGVGILGSGCVGMERGGEFWVGGQPHSGYQSHQSSAQPAPDYGSSDANAIATGSEILSFLSPTLGGKLLFGGLGSYARTEAQILGQKEAAGQIAGAIRGQGDGRRAPGSLRTYREGMNEYLVDDTQKIVYARGFMTFGPYPGRAYEGVILAFCHYFEDFKNDGLQGEDFIGMNNEFRRNEKITVFFGGATRDPPARTKVFDSNGTVIKDSGIALGGYGPLLTFSPGQLSSGNYAAVFYYQDQVIGKMEFRVTE